MRIALGIEYDGSGYFGWQRQAEVDSVQGQLEQALSKVANEPISLFCAGRTDAGVHATGQVVHFDTNAVRNEGAWTLGVNANLPDNIAVRWVKEVDESFHARFSATARRYRYVIYNHNLRPGSYATASAIIMVISTLIKCILRRRRCSASRILPVFVLFNVNLKPRFAMCTALK